MTSIGYLAFENCTQLTSLTIPESVNSVTSAFSGCSNLSTIIINCENIGAWFNYDSIKELVLGENVKSAVDYAFRDISNLSKVTVNCPVIGRAWFRSCESLKEVVLNEELTSIEAYGFYMCKALTDIHIPSSVTSIGNNAFGSCSSLETINLPEGLTAIGDMTFNNCTSLKEINIPSTVTTIGDLSFTGCSSLTSISLPEGLVRIGYRAFNSCTSLNDFNIPSTVISIGEYPFSWSGWYNDQPDGLLYYDNWLLAFKGDRPTGEITITEGTKGIAGGVFFECTDISSIAIPNSVISIGNKAFMGCKRLANITIPENVIVIDYSAFGDCSSLISVTSLIQEPFEISASTFSNDTYSKATLFVPVGTIDAYNSTSGWENFNNIIEIATGLTLTLAVTDERGEDLTDKVSITWYNAEGKQIGTGASLSGIEDGTELHYSVTLDEELGRIYHEVTMQKVFANDEAVTCQLEKIGRVTLEGRVSATDIDKNTMTVYVQQMLNGKWEQNYQTQTDEQGVFSVEVYDDETDITVSGDGYLDATLHRDGFSGNGNVGTIPVSLISGFAITANITMKAASAEGEEDALTAWTDALNNIDFALNNKAKGTVISDFTVQNGSVIIKTGATIGDEISLAAKSKQGIFAAAATTFTIEDGGNAFDLQLTELGGLDATCAASSNGSTVGYLYDSNGTLAAKGSYVGETLSLRHLKSGAYTLVSMGNSMLLGSMTQLSDITATGLSEGTDYATASVTVTDGELTAISVSEVPRLNEEQFYYTNNETYFSANKQSVTAGNYLTLQAHVDFKPEYADKADGVMLTIDLPEGCEMVENSVIANRVPVAHSVNGSRVTMQLSKEQYGSQVGFCIIPTLNQSYTVTAMAQFDIDGQVTQPIGTAQFEAKGLSLSVAKQTASTNVTVNGTAKRHSDVSIYDNDVLIGKTSSKADGSWTAQCELYKPYSHSFHDIYAKIVTDGGMELTSETQQVEYDKNRIVPEKVTMTFYNGWYRENKTVEFDLINGTTSPSSYPFYTGTDFTFLADFTRNDSALIKNVSIKVLNSDGTVRTLPAVFDGKQGKWVATTKYASSSRLPRNVMVEYELIENGVLYSFDSDCFNDDITQYTNILMDYVGNIDLEKSSVIYAKDSVLIYKYQTATMDTPVYVRARNLNYDEWIQKFEEQDYLTTSINGKTMFVYSSFLSDDYHISWYCSKETRTLSQIEISTNNHYGETGGSLVPSSIPKKTIGDVFGMIGRSVVNTFFCNAMGISDLINRWNTSMKEYDYWQARYHQSYTDHTKLYEKTFKKIFEKCPDGSYKIPGADNWKNNWIGSNMHYILSKVEYMHRSFESKLDWIRKTIDWQRDQSMGISSLIQMAGIGIGLNGLADGASSVANDIISSIVTGYGGEALDNACRTWIPNFFYQVEPLFVELSKWSMEQNVEIAHDFLDLQNKIVSRYQKCPEQEDEDEPKDDDDDFDGDGTKEIIDPSGYVYEAVLSNRLEGVTTTCYEKVNDEAVLWNAEDYSQQNPLQTDATGFYRWDVPMGMWQVKYEKEGYETAYSEWLPVPPPQLDVNIGMKQSTPPTVKVMRGYESGITIDMSKYMLPGTMNGTNITVIRNGSQEKGTVELLNAEQAPLSGETYVQKVKFVPQNRFHVTDNVVVTVHKDVESYCGVKMTADHVETVKIEPEITAIVADSLITVNYQSSRDVQVLVLPKDASAGRTLHIKTSSDMIASVNTENVKIDQSGLAKLTISGELPGGAVLDFTIDGSDMTATSKVKVVMGRDMVAVPVANIQSGSLIEGGSQIVLSCATEGATIYYTLDGSCPCDEATRHKYDGPITIATNVVVKAIAVKEGMDDSDIATFIYMVNGINDITAKDRFKASYTDGTLTITGADGGSIRVFDLLGRELVSRKNASGNVSIRVPKAESYIVSVTFTDGNTVVRKVTR